MNTQGDFQCLCTMGWAGKTCLEDFDECAAALCPAGTVCKSAKQSFTCVCPDRGCNNLDEALYNQQLSQTYGFTDDSGLDYESSGAVEEVVDEVVEESVDDLDEEFEENSDDYDVEAATESADATSEEMMVEDNDASNVYVDIDDSSEDNSYGDATDATAYAY